MAQQLIKNTKGVKVLTPTGYKNFSGMSKTWHEKVVEIKTLTRSIKCGLKHKFLVEPGWVDAEHIEVGMSLTTIDATDDPILSVQVKDEPQWLYDLLDVEGGNAYITAGIISHNCEFISSDAMLVDSIKLSMLRTKAPIREDMGFKFWKEVGGRNKTYLVGVDPATGNGSDFTAVQVVEFPGFEQVAELRLNTVNVPLIYSKIKWLLKELRKPDASKGRAEIIWSFERNGVGEALVAMIQNDDSADGGVYIDGCDLYNESNNGRLGCYTTGKSKLVNCMQLKNMVEKIKGGLIINSEELLFELKNYVAAGGSYQARIGCTDDLISGMLVVMKVLNRLSQYDDKARQVVYENVAPDFDPDQMPATDQFDGDIVPFTFL